MDEFGLLLRPRERTSELARELAKKYGSADLTDQHWVFIKSLSYYYEEFHVPQPAHKLCQNLHLQRGCGHQLFHTCLDAWRIAGLPDPGEEAKSDLSSE